MLSIYNRKHGLWESGDPVLLNNGAIGRAEGESRGTGEVTCGEAKQVLLRASNRDIPPDSGPFLSPSTIARDFGHRAEEREVTKQKDTDPEPRLIM